MSTIVSHLKLAIDLPKLAFDAMVEKWALGLTTYAELINQRLQKRVKSDSKFQQLISTPSSEIYQGLINPSFVSRSDKGGDQIVTDQAANLKVAFEKWQVRVNHAFESVDGIPAKRFKEAVQSAKESYRAGMARRSLPFTGFGQEDKGPAGIVPLWLTGDVTASGLIRSGDQVLEGGPYRICRDMTKAPFKAALANRIVQAGASILKANLQAADITRENTRTNLIVQGFVDPALGIDPFIPGGLSHVDYIVGAGDQLYLDIQVSRV